MWQTTKLTVELGQIVDNVDNPVDIWDFEYPSYYKGEEKKAFERKVIDHYYFRQIGQETVGRFLKMFRSRIRDIMPYYIQLYESEKYMKEIDDPFATVDFTETFESESSGTAEREHKFSDTPQGSITNLENYMSQASKDNDVSTGNVKHTLTKKGAMGVTTFGHDMIEYRQSFLNIDLMIINDLNDLFLGVY